MTTLQMASAYSVLANGGIYMKPYIIDKIVYNDGSEIQYEPEPIRRVIKESTSDTMITMLIDSVENGVAKLGAVEGYSIA
jgi:penicillin-binding protein 1A